MDKNFKINAQKLLAVEGKDECNFFNALLTSENMTSIQTVDIGGKEKFQIELPLLMNLEGFDCIEAIGFVRDAEDGTVQSAFQSIKAILHRNGLPVPDALNSVMTNSSLKLSVFIMPDNQNSGMLEDLCLFSLNGEPVKSCVNEFITCFSQSMQPKEKDKFNEPKARVQAYLSSRAPIVNSLGLAAQKGFWDFNHNCFNEIKLFLHNLFN
ncbi:hypothetical protein JXJ21_22165 [candidate division KSB1 bacterium]|nr:hypothetical protein [candidate division KSB1 bacterium]